MIEQIKKAIEVLRAGGVILYPTDTVWGIGCDATNPEAVAKLSALATKGLKELAENGPSAEHFNMAIENFKKNLPEKRINNSYWLNCLNTWVEQGINYDAEYEDAINTLTAEDVKAALQELLSQGNVISIASYPAE